jgi:TRAP-type C4-dicarboxylate transport system permease small subunit
MEMVHSNGMRTRSDAPARRRGLSFWTLALRVPEILCAATLALLILFLVISVFSRYAMDLGLTWSDEFARLLFAWIVLLGFAIAVRHRANVGVDWLVRKLGRRGQLALAVAQDVLILAFAALYTWEAWVTVQFSLIQRLPALDITIAWLYGSAFASGVLMVLYGIANLIDTLQGRLPPSHLDHLALSGESTRIE